MRSFDRLMVLRGVGCVSAMALIAAALPAAAQNDDQPSNQDIANSTYECATAMRYSEANGEPLRFSSAVLFDEFDAMIKAHGVSKDAAATFAKNQFDTLTQGMSESKAEDYIFDLAILCEELTIEREDRRIAAERAKADEQGGEINVAYLREHFAANRNPRVIADYIVDRYPIGKGLTGDPIAEGEYLGELIVELGPIGVRSFSDAAILSVMNSPYWQYNPPASKLVIEEYQRRLRVMKFNQRDAAAWAQRVQDERRADMENAAVRMSERLGAANVRCTNVAPQGVEGKSYTSCRAVDKYGQ